MRPRRLLVAAALAVASLVAVACATDPAEDPAAEPTVDDHAPDDPAADPTDDPDADARDPEGAGPPPLHPAVDGFDATEVTIDTDDGEVTVAARVAATSAERQQGLMHVPDLPDGVGMLFLFEEEHSGGFWMKNTLVPLDIAFADTDGQILAILSMEPCEADPCEVYDPGTTYTTALEVPQDWFEAEGVTTGDVLRWTDPVPADG